MTATSDPASLLRTSLRANAAFSVLSGSIFTLAATPVAGLLGIEPAALVTGVGLNLLGFAAALLWMASRPELSVKLALVVIALDLGWVLGTAALAFTDVFSRTGVMLSIGVANVVLVFAVVQWVGARRLMSSPAGVRAL
jgi:hypothetical protein